MFHQKTQVLEKKNWHSAAFCNSYTHDGREKREGGGGRRRNGCQGDDIKSMPHTL